jgi:glycolate oxidase
VHVAVADTLRFIYKVAERYDLTISNIFHAGDGNMHPIILFDPRKAGELDRTKKAGAEILAYCIKVGGAITGEHGVGMEKNDLMPMAFSQESLDMMETLIKVFDPDRRLNPGKLLPTGKGCLEVRPMTPRGQEMVW